MLEIRPATAADAALLMRFVRELAVYEKAEHEVLATEEDLRRDIFGPDSRVEALICERDGEPIGHGAAIPQAQYCGDRTHREKQQGGDKGYPGKLLGFQSHITR